MRIGVIEVLSSLLEHDDISILLSSLGSLQRILFCEERIDYVNSYAVLNNAKVKIIKFH